MRVTVPIGGTSAIVAADQFIYVPPPTITLVSPSFGPLSGGTPITISGFNFVGPLTVGTPITISGFNFVGPLTVQFGGIAAINVVVNAGANQISCLTPPSLIVSAVDVTVSSTVNGVATLLNGFTYNAPPTITNVTPNTGSSSGGTPITITGSNFNGT